MPAGETCDCDDNIENYIVNNFQARYAIRHLWDGPIQCENPVRNRWGGRPAQGYSQQGPAQPGPVAATDLTAQPRTGLDLQRVVQTAVPELGLRGGRAARAAPPVVSKRVGHNGRVIPQGLAALSAFGIVALLWRVLRTK